MSESTFEFILYAGILATIVGLLWLLATAWRTSVRRGLAVTLFPPLIPWQVVKGWPRTRGPALLLAVGLLAAFFPLAYTRLAPIDLGERVRIVEGEKHLTLTGWDRKDYAAIAQHLEQSSRSQSGMLIESLLDESEKGIGWTRGLGTGPVEGIGV